ncbi:MAG: X-Pro aminopeptidase [Candidatus Tokpelaia hoelldobleri]|uniref:X-Pro aminopeptidase n=1 Tax=Candidatus Tokpelaia hoelldobleri TaxID=1902579 RepID=A0A1U9JVX4_9HYPH|nr:MAG: X-Pro aminopeptidase [Candidatus Tokpelaia hoelldoblerii]
MFQSFDVTTNLANGAPRVEKLRGALARLGLDGFLVPRADEHQGEYVPPHAQRLGWLTGFTGSAGVALVLRDKALIFVDGRYTLQVRKQTDAAVFSYENLVATPPATWLEQNGGGLKIGFDPWLHTIDGARRLREALQKVGGELVSLAENPLDAVWDDQPQPPLGRVTLQPQQLAGKPAGEKLAEMQQDIARLGAVATVLTDPSSIAWCFNIRGSDVANTPLPLSFAVIPAAGRAELFIDGRKLGAEEKAALGELCETAPPAALQERLHAMAQGGKAVLLDPGLAAQRLSQIVEAAGGKVVEGRDPARLPRAVKNSAERQGARAAHMRDGVALVRFFAWLDGQKPGTQDEISVVRKLEELRAQTAEELHSKLEDISFDTISGAGADGAVIHYRVTTQTSRPLQAGELYLVDSGAQYRDGTTDITRTVAIGAAGEEERRCFTLVLKGMIALSMARFPQGTRGQDIDVLARIALWQNGFDYAHGTGHGVGAFLSVHEGPQSISRAGAQELLAGMIVSNEPGYYREGAFGIRIENLLLISKAATPAGGDLPMLAFETLTLCPIDRRLIVTALLNDEERNWLDAYHARVYEALASFVDDAERAWLRQAAAPL